MHCIHEREREKQEKWSSESERRTHSIKLHEQSYYKMNHFNKRPHILYCLMIENAIIKLKDRNGSAQGVNTNNNHFHPGRVRVRLCMCVCVCIRVRIFHGTSFRSKSNFVLAACILFVRNIASSFCHYILYRVCFVVFFPLF